MKCQLIVAACVALAAPAIAQQADMTRAQVEAKAAERFAKMDANADGVRAKP